MSDEKRNPARAETEPYPGDETPTEPMHGGHSEADSKSPTQEESEGMTARERAVARGLEKLAREHAATSFTAGPVEFTFVRTLEERSNGAEVLLFRRHFKHGLSGHVVVKRLQNPRTLERRHRMAEEVQLAFRLNHPAIAQVHHFRIIERLPHAILEYVNGPTLDSLICAAALRGAPLPLPLVLHVACEVADALHYAHTLTDSDNGGKPLGIIHRDVSLRNIRVDLKTGAVKLTDFGAAYSKRVGREETPERLRKGDLMYASPEYLRSTAMDARSDVFSLGLVLLEALTNRHFFACMAGPVEGAAPDVEAEQEPDIPLRELLAVVERYTPEDVERAAASLPDGLRAVVRRALKREPSERYASAEEMRREMRAYLVGLAPEYGRKDAQADAVQVISEASAKRGIGGPTEGGIFPEGFEAHELLSDGDV
jgi:serine/threonine-protein kinase